MRIKIPKPYWVIGSLTAASIIIVGGYNMIVANNKNVETSNENIVVEQKDYSDEIEQLKQRLTEAENDIENLQESEDKLKEQVYELEQENKNKTNEIANLKSMKGYNSKETKDLEGKLKNTENDLQELSDKIKNREDKIVKLLEEKQNLKEELKIYKEELNSVINEWSELNKYLLTSPWDTEANIEKIKNRMAELDIRRKELMPLVSNLEIQIEEIDNSINAL